MQKYALLREAETMEGRPTSCSIIVSDLDAYDNEWVVFQKDVQEDKAKRIIEALNEAERQ